MPTLGQILNQNSLDLEPPRAYELARANQLKNKQLAEKINKYAVFFDQIKSLLTNEIRDGHPEKDIQIAVAEKSISGYNLAVIAGVIARELECNAGWKVRKNSEFPYSAHLEFAMSRLNDWLAKEELGIEVDYTDDTRNSDDIKVAYVIHVKSLAKKTGTN